MSWLREQLNHPSSKHWTLAGAVVLLLAAGAVLWANFDHGPQDERQIVRDFWVDESTLSPVKAQPGAVPPVSNGKSDAVVGVYYSFGDASAKQLAYLKKYPPAAKAKIEQAMRSGARDAKVLIETESAALVRSPEAGSAWVEASSPEGQKLLQPPVGPDGRLGQRVWPVDR